MADWLWLAVVGAVGGLAWKFYHWAVEWLRRQFTVRVTIKDPTVYTWLAEWLIEQVEERDSTTLLATEHHVEKPGEPYDPLATRATFLPGEGEHVFWRGGRRIRVHHGLGGWKQRGAVAVSAGEPQRTEWQPASLELTTFGRDTWPLRSLVLEAEQRYRERRQAALSMWTARWGHWNETALESGRPLESVVLADGIAEELLTDVRRFLGARERYQSVGVPWRRGYLLHGTPGCGKSSLAKALATECALNLYVVSLVNVDDETLSDMMHSVRPHSLVLLEDVEAATEKRGDDGGVTRSGLLNAIDGVDASEGRVLVLTTNKPGELDPAIVRPGRIDRTYALGPATAGQAARLYERFFPAVTNGSAHAFGERAAGLTPATIQGHLIKHWDDPAAALERPDG